jgi:hypothetical protein
LVATVDGRLTEAAFRDRLRALHAAGTPLVAMVEQLGLGPQLTPALREILEGLSPSQVDGIRAATLQMLDRGERAMPLDCTVSQSQIDTGTVIDVAVVEAAGVSTIRVRPSASAST